MSSSKKENPSLLGQLLEMFGMSWPSEQSVHSTTEPTNEPTTPTCRSCGNPAPWSTHLNKWSCPNHPHAETNHPNE